VYGGWNGVDGQLQTPSSNITLGNYWVDHEAGWLGALWSFPVYSMQTGWYTGTVSNEAVGYCHTGTCVQRNGNYGRFVENTEPGGFYSVWDYGSAGLGSVVTSRVVYNGQDGCWEAYITYSGLLKGQDCSEPATGVMMATAEMKAGSGTAPYLPLAYFGTSNPNTDQAMRLHGANGWEPWDTSLVAQYTERFDEHGYTPKYVYHALYSYYWFDAYSG
jgi:hypothetical protein